MKYYLKIFLLSCAVAFVNIVIYLFLLQFQIVHNSSYVPIEALNIFLILVAIPVQFLILVLIDVFSKRNKSVRMISCGIFIVICGVLLWATSGEERSRYRNEQVYNKTEKYDYELGISTPEGYPVKLLTDSRFSIPIRGDRNPVTLLETNKVYSIKWGLGDMTFKSHAEGDITLPDSLNLLWYSYLEDKYYELKTPLDKNKISEYFKKTLQFDIGGNIDEIIPTKYKELVAGIAPGGDVVLWISGVDNTKELQVFKAREFSVKNIKDYDLVNAEDRKEVLNDTCACPDNLQFRRIVHNDKPIPFGIWTNKYRTKYNWKISINTIGQTKSKLDFRLFNGEEDALYNDDVSKMQYQKRALPSYIYYIFIGNKKKYKVYIPFDEDEIYSYFNQIAAENPEQPIDIQIDINNTLKKVIVRLQAKNQTLTFKNEKDISQNIWD